MYPNKDKQRMELDLKSIRQAYANIKEICYECSGDCDHCRVGDVREELVDIEKYIVAIK